MYHIWEQPDPNLYFEVSPYDLNELENLIINGELNFQLWLIALIVFIISWIIQFIGHEIEGKKPSFLKDLQLKCLNLLN